MYAPSQDQFDMGQFRNPYQPNAYSKNALVGGYGSDPYANQYQGQAAVQQHANQMPNIQHLDGRLYPHHPAMASYQYPSIESSNTSQRPFQSNSDGYQGNFSMSRNGYTSHDGKIFNRSVVKQMF